MKKQGVIILTSFMALALLMAFTPVQTGNDWKVPEKYEKMKNPVKADSESIGIGKMLYDKHCKSCHGKEGWGDGSKAAQLDTPCGDFSLEEFQEQSDGAIYYKTTVGRGDMPSFEKKIPVDEDRWHIVNYLRTMAE